MVSEAIQGNYLDLPEIPKPLCDWIWAFNFDTVPLNVRVFVAQPDVIDDEGGVHPVEPVPMKIGEVPATNAAMVRRVMNTDNDEMLDLERKLMWRVEEPFYLPGAMVRPDAVASIEKMTEDTAPGLGFKGIVRGDSPLYYDRTRGYNPPLIVPIWDTITRNKRNEMLTSGPKVGEPEIIMIIETEEGEPVYSP
jgi:hypothetical protein